MIENTINNQSDNLCTYINLQVKPHKTYILSVAILLIKITLKYGYMVQKTNKEIDKIFNVLSTMNIGS